MAIVICDFDLCPSVHLCLRVCVYPCARLRALTWPAVSLLHPDVAVALGDTGLGV